MIRAALFVVVTFALGWIAQAVFLFASPLALPAPHWLLLAVLAVGGTGRVNLAQGLGFFWGLALDVYGQTPFGAQALLLAACGYASGSLSKKLNAEKMVTQEALALVGTLVFVFGSLRLSEWFVPAIGPRAWGPATWLTELVMNGLAGPAVFWIVQRWLEWGDDWNGRAWSRD